MSSAQDSMEQWNQQFGDFDFFPEKERGKGSFSFELDVAYPCRITAAKCVRSKYGDLQLQIEFDVQGNDREDDDVPSVGSSKIWLDLPKQPGDLKRDRETVIKMTQRRYDNLLRVLSAAAPARYALYAEKQGEPHNYTYLDFDGEKMNGSDFNDRKQEIHSQCVKFADGLQEGEEAEIMQGALLYIVKAENKNNPKYPYSNIYSKRPEGKKMFASGDAKVPF